MVQLEHHVSLRESASLVRNDVLDLSEVVREIPTRNWEVSRKPATKHMTSTAVGQAVHAMANRKAMSASAERNMQSIGSRQVRQKKK